MSPAPWLAPKWLGRHPPWSLASLFPSCAVGPHALKCTAPASMVNMNASMMAVVAHSHCCCSPTSGLLRPLPPQMLRALLPWFEADTVLALARACPTLLNYRLETLQRKLADLQQGLSLSDAEVSSVCNSRRMCSAGLGCLAGCLHLSTCGCLHNSAQACRCIACWHMPCDTDAPSLQRMRCPAFWVHQARIRCNGCACR
jgi:hypothetical protein